MFLIVSVLLTLLNLDFLRVCFIANFHSRGWSSSSDWGICSLSLGLPGLQYCVRSCFDVFSPSWGTWRTLQLMFTELTGSLFLQSFLWFTILTARPSPKLVYVAALCVLSHSLQPFDVTSLTASDLLLYLNYDALVQRMR